MFVTPPTAFREHPSGLIVPEALSRRRQVWTKDEFRKAESVTKLLTSRKVKLLLKCGEDDCSDRQLVRVPQPDGGYLLRCGCTDRIFQRTF